jgi:hypothetical protein
MSPRLLRLDAMKKLALAVLAALMCACHERQTPSAPSPNERPTPAPNNQPIRGRVLDFATQAGVSGALVEFRTTQDLVATATTDASGSYVVPAETIGGFSVSVNGASAGTVRVYRPEYRGDLFANAGTCVSRYGTIADARTLKPVVGATLEWGNQQTTSGLDGWYRLDFGCSSTGIVGFNTTWMTLTHPNYRATQVVLGRGILGVRRLDIDMF